MQNLILIILTSHRRDCFWQCIRNLERHTDLALFSKIYVLANEVEPEHNALIQGFKRRHPNVRDIHCSPRGLGGCVIAMQNAVLKAHRKSLVVKMDEDLYVTEGWLEGLISAYQRHATDPKAILFSPVVPNNWVGRHCLRSHLVEWYGQDFNERLNTWYPVHTNTEYGVWIWKKVLEDGLEARIRQRATDASDFRFDEALNINCILFDSRLIDLMLPFRVSDEVEINACLKPRGFHAIMTLQSVAHHYSFGPQQQGIDEAVGMTRVARHFDERTSQAQNITSPNCER